MLSRTADHLFWMSRYMERAENTARMLNVNYETSLLPQSAEATEQGWRGLLSISELTPAYLQRYGAIDGRRVMDFMVRDEGNPSSILACLRAARENARAVRGTLTTEVWETQNQTWLEFNRLLRDGAFARDPGAFFEWVKFRSHLSRGVTVGTMLMDDALHFIRIGTFLERGDNTARLLDVKFHALAGEYFGPGNLKEGLEVDFYHWSAILRSVSGFEIYRKVRGARQPAPGGERAERRHAAPRRPAAGRPAVRPQRRDPRHRAACVPDTVPRPHQRPGRGHQPRLPGAAGGLRRPLPGLLGQSAAAGPAHLASFPRRRLQQGLPVARMRANSCRFHSAWTRGCRWLAARWGIATPAAAVAAFRSCRRSGQPAGQGFTRA